jgi:hypothetical protein
MVDIEWSCDGDGNGNGAVVDVSFCADVLCALLLPFLE